MEKKLEKKKISISLANSINPTLPDEEMQKLKKEFFKQLESTIHNTFPVIIKVSLIAYGGCIAVMIIIYFLHTNVNLIIADFKAILSIMQNALIFIVGWVFIKNKTIKQNHE